MTIGSFVDIRKSSIDFLCEKQNQVNEELKSVHKGLKITAITLVALAYIATFAIFFSNFAVPLICGIGILATFIPFITLSICLMVKEGQLTDIKIKMHNCNS